MRMRMRIQMWKQTRKGRSPVTVPHCPARGMRCVARWAARCRCCSPSWTHWCGWAPVGSDDGSPSWRCGLVRGRRAGPAPSSWARAGPAAAYRAAAAVGECRAARSWVHRPRQDSDAAPTRARSLACRRAHARACVPASPCSSRGARGSSRHAAAWWGPAAPGRHRATPDWTPARSASRSVARSAATACWARAAAHPTGLRGAARCPGVECR
mmetsp:Transcript_47093/g.118619  ORF Transcript_47093/g.118619 Transcript_47093/m.118619 type:complete len:212 (+) Transcript_47093:809-1444(+)